MNSTVEYSVSSRPPDYGLAALCGIAAYFRVSADPHKLATDMGLLRPSETDDILRAARIIKMRAKLVSLNKPDRIMTVPSPAIVRSVNGEFLVYGGRTGDNRYRVVDPLRRIEMVYDQAKLLTEIQPFVILVGRQRGGPGAAPQSFGINWFLPSLWRYRKPITHVLVASFVLQIFALITPLFFQIIVDKVLVHQSYETLYVLIAGLILVGTFECIMQFMRTYVLSHTTNRIDVELGRKLFGHLLALPLSFFESNAAGQTVARIRELENVRNFLTGQALFSILDLVFATIMICVLLVYSVTLTLILLATIPFYIVIATIIRPILRDKIKERFNRGAESQQYLVESVIGIHTLKSAAVEPIVRNNWEEKLAEYVRTSFQSSVVAAGGQNGIQFVSKLGTAAFLFFGAQEVMNGTLSVGELVAFNMISAQVIQPVLRLSQLWQDFQQIRVSMDRIGDILNRQPENINPVNTGLQRPNGRIEFQDVSFRYRPGSPVVLNQLTFKIEPGEVVGIVGPSGSGKSTLSKLIQRLYDPSGGQIMIDGIDITHTDSRWLRSNVGVVLQENLLFNRSVHDNIALVNPAASRRQVIAAARLAGADEFIQKMQFGYDTIIEERGTNLSGGQRQRIAIARSLIVDPPILILDEATSALDYESERTIRRNMTEIVNNRTVLIIAHRLSTVRQCDKIIAMEAGQIVEMGSHDELLRRPDGLYARLWRMQTEEV